MIHLVWGQDDLLATEATSAIVEDAGEDVEVLTFSADGAEVPGLIEALRVPSLFGPERVVVVHHAERLTAAGVDVLADALAEEVVPLAVVIEAVADREPRRLVKTLTDVAKVTKLRKPRRRELTSWVERRMRSYKLTPGKDAAETFIEAVGEGLRDLDHAIAQIATRAGKRAKVERKHVLAHFGGTAEQPVWALFDALAKRDAAGAYGVLSALLDAGQDPIPILFAIVSQVRLILRTKGLLDRSAPLSDDDLAHALGASRGRAAVVRRQSGRIPEDWLLALYALCAEADVELKGGEDGAVLPSRMVLERLIGRAVAA